MIGLVLKTSTGLAIGGVAVIVFGNIADLPGPLAVAWPPDPIDGPSERLTVIRSGIRSPIVAAIWMFVWVVAGMLMGIRGLNFGDKVRVALGPFDGTRISAVLIIAAIALTLSAGLWELGWLWFSAAVAVFLIIAILLIIIGTINVSGGY